VFHQPILVGKNMSNSFVQEVEKVFQQIEDCLDKLDMGIESMRQGPVLEIEFEDDSKILINSQAGMQELWMASKAGGFHFRQKDGRWLDTRSGDEFFALLSRFASQQAGQAVIIA
jgi:CyaY protein